MFLQSYSALMSHISSGIVPIPKPDRLYAARAESDALRAMQLEPKQMRLSERMENPEKYARLQRERRNALEALLIVAPTQSVADCALDLICMIAEESAWAELPKRMPFDEEGHPHIDLNCAETAVLFGWTRRILGQQLNKLNPLIENRLLSEVRRRVFKPFMAHEDYPFMRAEGGMPITILCDILLSCLLLETDAARCGRTVKKALKLLDDACRRQGQVPAPLAASITEISAVSDLVAILDKLTRGAVNLTHQLPSAEWLDELLFPWIDGPYFNDPAGDGMKPALSGSDLFRIGLAAEDDALSALGASLFHAYSAPSVTVTGRLTDCSLQSALESQAGRPPRLRYAATGQNRLMAARIPGLYCALHAGGNRANAGDLALFADGAPILVDGGRRIAERNLPRLAGYAQLPVPEHPCPADFEALEDREIMSIDLTPAYPPACGIKSYQRTVMTLRGERTVRVMDAFELSAPTEICFHFITPTNPVITQGGVRLGAVHLTWEGALLAQRTPLSESPTLCDLTLTTQAPVDRAYFAFNFERT